MNKIQVYIPLNGLCCGLGHLLCLARKSGLQATGLWIDNFAKFVLTLVTFRLLLKICR